MLLSWVEIIMKKRETEREREREREREKEKHCIRAIAEKVNDLSRCENQK